MTHRQFYLLITLLLAVILVMGLVLANSLYTDQAGCERSNAALTQREIVAHRHLAPQLNCSLFFPQGDARP